VEKKIGLKEAMSVLGLAVSLAQGGTPVSFLIAGDIALITSYSYVKLTLAFPDRGGTVKFINTGFGQNVFSGSVNNLLWVSYIIMIALYASAFGSYAPNLFSITGSKIVDAHIYSSAIIILASAINYYSIKVVGQIESYAVIIKLVILIAFAFIGGYGLIGNPNVSQLSMSQWKSPIQLITAGMVIFVAYEGFELIANAAPDIINPSKNIPKAYYYTVLFVIALYVAIAFITVGSLPFSKIATVRDYVLAEAAKPMLGRIGFTIITIAALLSTFSAINASLLGGSRVSHEIGTDGELPHEFTSQLWNKPLGLFITTIATLILVNSLHLESISIAGSIGFLLVFAVVNYAGFRLSAQINGTKTLPFSGFILCLLALAIMIIQQYASNKIGVLIAGGIILSCFVIEFWYKKRTKKKKD
jgi:amino acid transporter